jgi:hypothetical protein
MEIDLNEVFAAVAGFAPSTAIAVGEAGALFRTTDIGASWLRMIAAGGPDLNAVAFGSASNIVAVGDGGRIEVSTNAGVTWQSVASSTTRDLVDVDMNATGRAVAVGKVGTVVVTADFTQPWTTSSTGITNDFTGVSLGTGQDFTAVIGNGRIMSTTTFGAPYQFEESGTINALYAVDHDLQNRRRVVGASGTILTDDPFFELRSVVPCASTSAPLLDIAPVAPILLQPARPNPTSSSAALQFALANAGHVSLRVHDAAGRLVATLVHEQLRAGTHSADWSAEARSAGVYFAVLESGGARQTRKLVVLR